MGSRGIECKWVIFSRPVHVQQQAGTGHSELGTPGILGPERWQEEPIPAFDQLGHRQQHRGDWRPELSPRLVIMRRRWGWGHNRLNRNCP